MLELSWWWKAPIDFEMKQYQLLAYTRDMDKALMEKVFSPWILHSEKLHEEMVTSRERIRHVDNDLARKRLVFTEGSIHWMTEKPPKFSELEELEEILEFAIPVLDSKIKLGKALWKKHPTLLWG